MKDKRILILILVIIIDPLLILLTMLNKSLNPSTRNSLGIIEIVIYVLALIFSILLINKKKKNNE